MLRVGERELQDLGVCGSASDESGMIAGGVSQLSQGCQRVVYAHVGLSPCFVRRNRSAFHPKILSPIEGSIGVQSE